jgi:hypothetical protein
MASKAGAEATISAARVYRKLLTLIRRMPAEKRPEALQQVREGFRKNAGETDPER